MGRRCGLPVAGTRAGVARHGPGGGRDDHDTRYKLVAGYLDKEILAAGGLLVFGPERNAPYRHAADYVRRILQRAKPAELPSMQPTEYWLGVNLRTARALVLTIPRSVLIRADDLIE